MPDGYELFDAELPDENQQNTHDPKKSNSIITVLSVLVMVLSVCVVLLVIDKLADNNYKVIVVDANAGKYNQAQLAENEEELSKILAEADKITEVRNEIKTTAATADAEKSTSVAVTSAVQQSTSVQSAKININTASAAQLTQLKGIGEKKAQAIIEYRNENGAFGDIEEITKVSGIGDKIFEGIKDYITVG